MPEKSKYCLDFDAKIEELLEQSLVEIAIDASDLECSKHLQYLVLGGGYGRGEGGILRIKDGDAKLFNDLDFFVICKDDTKKIDVENMNLQYAKLGKKWSEKLGIDVDFGPATKSSEIAKRLDMLMWREMVLGATLCIGDKDEFGKYFKSKISQKIPPREISKLLFNRIYGFAQAKILLEKRKNTSTPLSFDDRNFISRNINKAILSCADAVLSKLGIYELKTDKKLLALQNIAPSKCDFIKELNSAYEDAAKFKRNPSPANSIEEFEIKITQAENIIFKTKKFVEKYLSKNDDVSMAETAKNFVKNLGQFTNFFKLGMWNVFALLRNPQLNAMRLQIKLLKSKKLFKKRYANTMEKIWKKLN